MYDIINLTVQAMKCMGIEPDYVEDELIVFEYQKWPCLCEKCSPYSIKVMVYLCTSYKDFSWESEAFHLELCKCISDYKMSYEDYLHEEEGMLMLVQKLTPPFGEDPDRQMRLQLINFFSESIPRAKEHIESFPNLRDALGQFIYWGWTSPQDKISQMGVWTDIRQYTEGLVAVANSQGRYGFLDADAHIAIQCKWAYAQPFSEGLAAIENEDGRYGFIDRKGQVAIPCEWHRAEWFSEGLAAVMSASGEWGFIDIDARLVILCEWSEVDDFHNGRAQVWDSDGSSYIIDQKGIIVEY